ncbi:MAG: tRNA (adenosine(37)-N6)-threonylcarbamoyltransferase complex dimerization subunit type 1 TsaB [Spirochaetaceae bacterium]|jgi:tRNA threonylcarbamoyladenosine biosynthesis protein TsaB|nr:tRNA (adenosine(37)-N6)-threonylcarbamoyltransferase complex dimerization subunit type 1 TsaB [Spirochaetaceae bacterium]
MNVLAIDCATELLSAALRTDAPRKGAVYSMQADAGTVHSEILFTVVDALLTAANVTTQEIDLFLCQRGPGSWTGLRIGFSVVKGFALALNKPFLSIPTLDCAALAAPQSGFDGVALPVLDAKQRRYFCALFENGQRMSEYLDATPETIAALVPPGKDVWLTGNAAAMILPRLQELLAHNAIILDPHFRKGRAEDLLHYLAKNPTIVERKESFASAPLYLRKSDAEINAGA